MIITPKSQHRVFARLCLGTSALLLTCAPHALATPPQKWVTTWASAQQIAEPHNALSANDFSDITLRQMIHLSLGGERFRIRLSNLYGTAPLTFESVHVAQAHTPLNGSIVPLTDRVATFGGKFSVTIPAGADYVSDPVDLALGDHANIAISVYLAHGPQQQTSHPGSRTTSYYVHGNHVSNSNLFDTEKVEHWYNIASVEVMAPSTAVSVAIIGDSITDGRCSTTDGNDRWPDLLALRLTGHGFKASVLNLGIGGNRLLEDGIGPKAVARFSKDILGHTQSGYVIIFEGVNDLGSLTVKEPRSVADHETLVENMKLAYLQMIEAAHAQGLKVYGVTLLPYGGNDYYHPDATNEADRQAVNEWIRHSGAFDAVLDFDMVIRDPEHPERMRPDYDCGDHLHPGPQGFKAMADSIDLELFAPKAKIGFFQIRP